MAKKKEEITKSSVMINREELFNALSIAKNCLASKSTVPLFTNFCLVDDVVLAFNGSQGISVKQQHGLSNCFQGDLLLKTISSYSVLAIEVGIKDEQAIVGTTTLATLPATDFPFRIKDVKGITLVDVSSEIIEGISKCLPFVNKKTVDNSENGVILNVSKDRIAVNAIDDLRAVQFVCYPDNKPTEEVKVILPYDFCKILLSIAKTNKDFTLSIDKDEIMVNFGENIKLFTKIDTESELFDFDKTAKEYNITNIAKDKFEQIDDEIKEVVNRIDTLLEKDTNVDISFRGSSIRFTGSTEFVKVDDKIKIDADIDEFKATLPVFALSDVINLSEKITFVPQESNVIIIGVSDNFTILTATI